MSTSTPPIEKGLGGSNSNNSSKSDTSPGPGNEIEINPRIDQDEFHQTQREGQRMANVDDKPTQSDDTDPEAKVADDSDGTEKRHSAKNGQGATGAHGVVTVEGSSKTPKSSQSRYGHFLRKCSVSLKDISLCRDPILRDLYQSAVKGVKQAPPPAKPKNTLYPDFSPKEIPLPLLFPGLSPPVPSPVNTSVRGKRGGGGGGKRGRSNSFQPASNSQPKPKYNRRPLPVRPSLPYIEPIFVKPAYLNHAERLMNSSFGPFGRVNAAELVALCKELADARGMIDTLRSQLTNAIMSESEKNEPMGNVMNLADLPEPKLNKSENMMAPSGYRIIDMQLLSLALDAAQRCEHENSNRKLQIYEMHSTRLNLDLAKSFAFVCTVCKKATVFPNSSFSKEWPPNYSVNKQFLQVLGAKPFQRTVNFIRKGEKPSALLPRFSSDPAQLVLSIDQKAYKTNLVPSSPPHPVQPSRSPPRNLPRINLLNGKPGKKSKTPTKIKASPLLPVGSRISVIPPGTQVSGHVNFTTTKETGLKPGVYRVNTTGYPERLIAVKDEELRPSDGCIDLDSVAGPSSSVLDMNINALEDPIATSSSIGELEDGDDDDDPPDFSHFLDVSLGGGENNLMGADSLMDQNSNNGLDHMNPSSKDNEAKPADFKAWQNDDESIVEDTFADPLLPEVTLGSDSNYNDDDDSDVGLWKGEPSRKQTRKRKMIQSKNGRPKRPKNIIPEEIILS